jgi:nucleoside-diphosphate-sugar epimerase
MNIFLTGASGYIGGAIAEVLRNADHDVAALVRAEAETKHLRDLGVVLIGGELELLPSMRAQLADYDAFIHIAQARPNTVISDRAAIDTFTALRGHFLFTSGVWVIGNNLSADESSSPTPLPIVAWRVPHEELVLAAGGAVLRPGCVYGGRQSLCADWFAAAEQKRATQLVGDGRNHWAMVDLHDLADLYLRAIEQKTTGILHGIDDTHATLEECVHAVGPDVAIEHIPLEAARATMGPFADALAVDQRISSTQTREKTGWNPKRTFMTSIAEQWQEWRDARK